MSDKTHYTLYGDAYRYKEKKLDWHQGNSKFNKIKFLLPKKYQTENKKYLTIIPSGDCGIVGILNILKLIDEPTLRDKVSENIDYDKLSEESLLNFVYEHRRKYELPIITNPIFTPNKVLSESDVKEAMKKAFEDATVNHDYNVFVNQFGNGNEDVLIQKILNFAKYNSSNIFLSKNIILYFAGKPIIEDSFGWIEKPAQPEIYQVIQDFKDK